MAHVYGKPGGFAKEEYTRRMLRYFCIVYAVVIVAGAAIGFVCGLGQKGGVISLYCLVGFIVFTLLAWLVLVPRFERFLDRRAKEASNWKAGYTGEAQVANLLEDLPDDFHVFHDVKHRDLAGNIDHLVVGPTGVFVLETKNWRGHVEYSPDKKLLNDGRDKTAEMNALLQRVFSVRDKIEIIKMRTGRRVSVHSVFFQIPFQCFLKDFRVGKFVDRPQLQLHIGEFRFQIAQNILHEIG